MRATPFMAVVVAATVGVVCGLAPDARARSGFAGALSCVVANPGGGALQIKTTMAVEAFLDLVNPSAQIPIDVTMRLERSGVTHFDRVSITARVPDANEELICLFLPHEDSADPEVIALGDRLRTALGLSPSRVFCITNKSITNAEALGADSTIPPTYDRASSLADVTVYAVEGQCTP